MSCGYLLHMQASAIEASVPAHSHSHTHTHPALCNVRCMQVLQDASRARRQTPPATVARRDRYETASMHAVTQALDIGPVVVSHCVPPLPGVHLAGLSSLICSCPRVLWTSSANYVMLLADGRWCVGGTSQRQVAGASRRSCSGSDATATTFRRTRTQPECACPMMALRDV